MSTYLSLEDFKGRKFNPHWTRFEILLEIAQVAREKLIDASIIDDHGNVKVTKEQVLKAPEEEPKPIDAHAIAEPEGVEKRVSKGQELNNSSTDACLRRTDNNQNNIANKPALIFDDEDCVMVGTPSKKQKLNGSPTDTKTSASNEKAKEEAKHPKRNNIIIKPNVPTQTRPISLGPSSSQPTLPPEYEVEFMGRIDMTRPKGEINLTRLIRKNLFQTDVSKGQGRLSMPFSQIENFKFLKDGERAQIEQKMSVKATLVHKPMGEGEATMVESHIELTEWVMHKGTNQKESHMYVLRSGWNKIVESDGLKCGDLVEVWCFRNREDRLCIILVVLERAGGKEELTSSASSSP
ncbi:B3 domain-containing protein [Senna tora]|uniref:B3 domain-containing protein n=1 Tax=Senna tora TaxID=362788 RepID=A0A834T5K3_9FABA|nr:B3 domain-containing protein [Senna tora]